jgi:isopentenyl-diphosphate delta-isomerase
MNKEEYITLVDDTDTSWGKMEKMEVHQLGLLHRAFSVFIFNSNGELLLQQRAFGKYHSGGLWTNTCCSHPHYGEDTSFAATRRLVEEMGIRCPLDYGFSFVYKVRFENGLIENEYDHVYFGVCDAPVRPDPEEVRAWKYMSMDQLITDMKKNPAHYTEWLKICIDRVMLYLDNKKRASVA